MGRREEGCRRISGPGSKGGRGCSHLVEDEGTWDILGCSTEISPVWRSTEFPQAQDGSSSPAPAEPWLLETPCPSALLSIPLSSCAIDDRNNLPWH